MNYRNVLFEEYTSTAYEPLLGNISSKSIYKDGRC